MSPRCRNCEPVPKELRAAAGLLERRWTMATIYEVLERALEPAPKLVV